MGSTQNSDRIRLTGTLLLAINFAINILIVLKIGGLAVLFLTDATDYALDRSIFTNAIGSRLDSYHITREALQRLPIEEMDELELSGTYYSITPLYKGPISKAEHWDVKEFLFFISEQGQKTLTVKDLSMALDGNEIKFNEVNSDSYPISIRNGLIYTPYFSDEGKGTPIRRSPDFRESPDEPYPDNYIPYVIFDKELPIYLHHSLTAAAHTASRSLTNYKLDDIESTVGELSALASLLYEPSEVLMNNTRFIDALEAKGHKAEVLHNE